MAWKKHPVTFRQRAYAGLVALGKPSLVVIAVLGAAASCISLVHSGLAIPVAILFLVAVVSAVVYMVHIMVTYRGQLIPRAFVDEMTAETSYSWRFCTRQGLQEACDLTKPCLGNDYVEFDVLESWRQKCPEGFVELLNSEGLMCACFVILGLADSFTEEFIAGRLTEKELDADCILSSQEAKTKNRLYLCGVVVRDHGKLTGAWRAKILLWTMLQYVRDIYDLRTPRRFFGVAATDGSERLMRNFSFDLIGKAHSRRDEHNLYEITLDESRWKSLLTRVGDFSLMCKRSEAGHDKVPEMAP